MAVTPAVRIYVVRSLLSPLRRLGLCLAALGPTLAGAQPPPPPQPLPSREINVEFAFVSTSGNASTQTVGLAGEVVLRPDAWVFRTRAAFLRNEVDDAVIAESLQYLFRVEHQASRRASTFAEYTFFRDRFAGVDSRQTLVAGLLARLVQGPAHEFSVDAGAGYVDERRRNNPRVSSVTYVLSSRYRWRVSPTAELTDEGRFSGRFERSEDWRVDHTVAVSARITTLLSLKLSNSLRYAHDPVPGFRHTDTTTSVALVAKF